MPCLDFDLVQAGIRVFVRKRGRDVARLLPETEERGHVEGVVRKRGVSVHGGKVVPDVGVLFEVVAGRGARPVPRPPVEGFVLGLEFSCLLRRVEERVVAVVVEAAVVLGRVRVGLVRGAALEFRAVREVVERRHAVPVAPAERAEGGLLLRVDVHVDALAVCALVGGVHGCGRLTEATY